VNDAEIVLPRRSVIVVLLKNDRSFMMRLTLLTAMTAGAMAALGAIKTLAPITPAFTTPHSASMDIDELQRKIDMRTLPELEIHELY
jgi:hypothetical protein